MPTHSKGNRTRGRKILRKSPRERGAVPSLSKLMREYREGDKVSIKINPSVHSGMPHRRYQGKTGVILGVRGKSYEVKVKLGDKEKILVIRPEHLAPVLA